MNRSFLIQLGVACLAAIALLITYGHDTTEALISPALPILTVFGMRLFFYLRDRSTPATETNASPAPLLNRATRRAMRTKKAQAKDKARIAQQSIDRNIF